MSKSVRVQLDRFPIRLTISVVSEKGGTFGRRELLESGGDFCRETVQGPRAGLAEERLEFGERLLDGIEVGAVGRELGNEHTAAAECFAHAADPVGGYVVHDDDVAASQRRSEHLIDIGDEALAGHGSFEQHRRREPVMAQRGNEGHGFPSAERHLADEPLPARRPAVEAGHVGGHRSFIDEDEAPGVKFALPPTPRGASRRDVRPILLGGVQDFFLASGRDDAQTGRLPIG